MKIGDKVKTTVEYNDANKSFEGVITEMLGPYHAKVRDVDGYHLITKKTWLELA